MAESTRWDAKVEACFGARFKASPRALDYYLKLWREHQSAELAGDHFVSELTSSSDEKLWQRIWEMSLGRHLRACGHGITTRPEGGPDYFLKVGDRRVWIEAISPAPGPDLSLHWTSFDPSNPGPNVGLVPHKQMLLRWTSAFKAKADKCLQYRNKGVVRPSDAFVIAVDGSQLSKLPFTHGISQVPFVVETVFAIGPIAIEVDQATGKLGQALQTVETAIENRNKAIIPKERFLRAEFSGISAVLGCYAKTHAAEILPVQVAYNPLAQSPMPQGQFGAEAEE